MAMVDVVVHPLGPSKPAAVLLATTVDPYRNCQAGSCGIDLTDAAVEHAQRRLELEEFEGVRVSGFPTAYDRQVAGPRARVVRMDWFLGVLAS